MTRVSIFLFLVIIPFSNLISQKGSSFYLGFGMPVFENFQHENFNFSSQMNYSFILCKNLETGIGIGYTNIDIKPASNRLTFDKTILNAFLLLNYNFQVNERLFIIPELNAGYATIYYSNNEFDDGSKTSQGIFLNESIGFGYNITKSIFLKTKLCYNTIFSKYKIDENRNIPANYMIDIDNNIRFWNVILGMGIKF